MIRFPGFCGPSYTSQSKIADAERCVNWYPERIEGTGKAPLVLYPTPGFRSFATVPQSNTRALVHVNGRTFAVCGSALVEIRADGTVATLGTGLNNLDGSPAQIVTNGDGGHQLFVTSGSKGYLYDLSTNTYQGLVLDGAEYGAFIDGFFLALDSSTSRFKISDLENGATWDAGQVAQRNVAADKWSGMLVAHKEIWLFGSQTTEVWYNAGTSPFPFTPNPSVFINAGIAAPASAALLGGAPVWLGQTRDGGPSVYRAEGYTPVRVSNHAVEYALAGYATVADAQAWTYEEYGHLFYVLTLPNAGATWVFDASTGLWHERGTWDGSRFRSAPTFGHCYAWGKHLTGSNSTAVVYEMNSSLTGDGGTGTIRRLRRTPHASQDATIIGFDRLQVDLEAGLGLVTGQGSDPQVMLRWSNDGGQTWGSERWVSAGLIGAYKARAQWWRLGQGRDRVFEVAVSDPIPWRLVDAYLDVRMGSA